MSLQTPTTIRTRQRKLYREAKMLGAEVSRNTSINLAARRVPCGEASRRAGCRRSARPVR